MTKELNLALAGRKSDELLESIRREFYLDPPDKILRTVRGEIERVEKNAPDDLSRIWNIFIGSFDGARDELGLKKVEEISDAGEILCVPYWAAALLLREHEHRTLGFDLVIVPTMQKVCLLLVRGKLLEIPISEVRDFVSERTGTVGVACIKIDFDTPRP